MFISIYIYISPLIYIVHNRALKGFSPIFSTCIEYNIGTYYGLLVYPFSLLLIQYNIIMALYTANQSPPGMFFSSKIYLLPQFSYVYPVSSRYICTYGRLDYSGNWQLASGNWQLVTGNCPPPLSLQQLRQEERRRREEEGKKKRYLGS